MAVVKTEEAAFDPADARACKRIIAAALAEHGLFNRLTARTIDFTDLARMKMVFVSIHDWSPSPLFTELDQIARSAGFRVEAY
jgi:hypothetical protein